MGVEVGKKEKGKSNKRVFLSREWSPVVPIQTKGSKIPLFCVHALFGNVLKYYALSKYLGSEQPLYGLQAQGTDGKKVALSTFEEMAELYIKEMKKVQPEGPYMLAGYSIGGEIAFEMAHQLIEHGDEVSFLGLFDTLEPGFARAPDMKKHIKEVRDQADQLASKKKKKGLKNLIVKRVSDTAEEFMTTLSPAICRVLLSFNQNMPQLLIRYMLVRAHNMALKKYTHKRYPEKLTLFRATRTQSYGTAGSPLTWESLSEGEFDLKLIEGNHDFFKEPYVDNLAELVRASIQESNLIPDKSLI